MKNIAIIPARAGSKGLRDKNIRLLSGKPLMAYSIEAAIESEKFDEVMVSTDSVEYADIACTYGAKVPFMRRPELSGDTVGSWDVVKHVIDNYRQSGILFDTICLLQPTSPLRTASDIVAAYNLYEKEASVAVVSVCAMDHPPQWSNVLPVDCSLNGFLKKDNGNRRQEQDIYYRLNGAIYIVNVNELYQNTDLYREGSFAYIMPASRSVDIDTEFDFKLAGFLISLQDGSGRMTLS